MQIGDRRRKHLSVGVNPDLEEKYPCAIQFYTTPPQDNITLEEFGRLALERLQVLRIVEKAGLKLARNSPQYKAHLQEQLFSSELRSYLLHHSGQISQETLLNRKKDHISHFILRLAFCKTEELRRWFIKQELDLFRFRFSLETMAEKAKFLCINNLDYSPISTDEKEQVLSELLNSTFGLTAARVKTINYYKVPFEDVIELVQHRRVYLKKGYAYVAEMDLSTVIGGIFRQLLSHSLVVTLKSLPHLEEDNRLLKMLVGLDQCYIGKDYSVSASTKAGEVTPEMIDKLSTTSFPLCMRILHKTLCSNHHLKHGGRMQYGLFLKGIGLSLEDALCFWKSKFTKNMPVDKFDKSYAYNIRHNYGKEGKRTNYTPYSCAKIIQASPGPGDTHGCPFKHSDTATLKQHLQSQNISYQEIQEILGFVSKGFYQLACTKYFEITHKGFVPGEIQHPNQYFEESRKVLAGNGQTTEQYEQESSGSNIPASQEQSKSLPETSTQKSVSTGSDKSDMEFTEQEKELFLHGVW